MEKLILLAEEGERKLIHEVGAQLGCADWLAQYDVLVTGVGAINIIRALRHLPADTEILNIGYAGSANFNLGTLVAVTEARLNHPHVSYPEPALPLETPACATLLTRAVCYSNTDFVLQSDYRDWHIYAVLVLSMLVPSKLSATTFLSTPIIPLPTA